MAWLRSAAAPSQEARARAAVARPAAILIPSLPPPVPEPERPCHGVHRSRRARAPSSRSRSAASSAGLWFPASWRNARQLLHLPDTPPQPQAVEAVLAEPLHDRVVRLREQPPRLSAVTFRGKQSRVNERPDRVAPGVVRPQRMIFLQQTVRLG